MTIWVLGSINIDHVYTLPHLPAPGETLAAESLATGLGGKGANQSIAIARAGGDVRHIGAVGPEGDWCVEGLAAAGVDVTHVARVGAPTGHAIVAVDAGAENAIILLSGANQAVPMAAVEAALEEARPGDWLLMQNETNGAVEAAKMAKARGLKIAYAAAPFEARAVAAILPYGDLISMNEVEAAQMAAELPEEAEAFAAKDRLITYGAAGAALFASGAELRVEAFRVDPVDTTGAGDTFFGYALAGFDQGLAPEAALRRAAAASALQVTRPGAADAIPTAAEVEAFLAAT